MGKRWLVAGVAVAAISVAAGCGSGETTTGEPAPSTVTSSSATSANRCTLPVEESRLESILALVPDNATTREYTTVADLRAFLDDQGKALLADWREIEWVDSTVLFTPTELLRGALSQADEETDPLDDELGLGLGAIDQAVTAGMAPATTELLIGTFEPAAVDEAVGADPFWSPQETTVEAHGETYYSWGGDGEVQAEGRSAVRNLGIGGRLWVDGSVAAFTRTTATMDAFLAACTGAEPTLADDATYAGIAANLAAFDGAFHATFTDQVREPGEGAPTGSAGTRATAPDAVAPLEGLVAYGYASGPADAEDRARIRLVLAFGSDADAATNEQLLVDRIEQGASTTTGQAWADVLTVERTEVDGSFLIVELDAKNAQVLENDLFKRDSLLVSTS